MLVLGDSMADWLAYGLEDALGDPPDLGVVRKHRTSSGLIRYDTPQRDAGLGAGDRARRSRRTKPKFIVMMVGLNDRQSIRERVPLTAPTGRRPGCGAGRHAAAKPARRTAAPARAARPKPDAADAEQARPARRSPRPSRTSAARRATCRIHEFRSDEWAELYTKRIDATIAALKSAGVPVFWVGLPSIRGPKSTSDMQYLNDLYRARAEKAGITYIDVWDGFVDDSGRFIAARPRLRRPDPPAARRRRRALHQGRRAQACALSSSAKSAAC